MIDNGAKVHSCLSRPFSGRCHLHRRLSRACPSQRRLLLRSRANLDRGAGVERLCERDADAVWAAAAAGLLGADPRK